MRHHPPSLAAAIVTEVRLLQPSVFCNRVGGVFLVAPKHELPIREHSGLRVALGLEIVVLRLSVEPSISSCSESPCYCWSGGLGSRKSLSHLFRRPFRHPLPDGLSCATDRKACWS